MLQDYSIPPAAADTPSKTINKPPPPVALTAPILFRKIRKHPKKFVLNANLSFSLLPLVLPHTYNTNRENHCKLENCVPRRQSPPSFVANQSVMFSFQHTKPKFWRPLFQQWGIVDLFWQGWRIPFILNCIQKLQTVFWKTPKNTYLVIIVNVRLPLVKPLCF